MESILGFWDRCTEACSSCTSCTTLVIPETHRLARFGKKIRGKSVHEKTIDFSMSHGSDLAGSYARSFDGLGADGELTPGTKKTALEAMRKVLNRAEFTPRTPRDFDDLDEEEEEEVTRKLQTKFLDAARAGNFRQVVEGLAEGVDLHCTTARGQSALMLAAASRGHGSLQIISFLLECQMHLEGNDNLGWTALLHACRNNMSEAVELLLQSRADAGAKSIDGQNAAMLAAAESGDELVMRIVDCRVQLDRSDRRGHTLLFYAVEHGREELVKWLLKRKVNPNARAKDKSSCMMLAAERGHLSILKTLCNKNADANAKSVMGNSPLLLSVMNAQETVARYLLNIQADCNVKNQDGVSALDAAARLKLGPLKSLLDVLTRKSQERGGEDDDDLLSVDNGAF
ncbi:unnamed protein product [Durusdinium trenchii]|uniref:ANK_REP_REGION domain-containing protein n=1 Tax=Durusdinium trenchii TaxID=1381693 RepID=A0ABP0JUM8_9DINO